MSGLTFFKQVIGITARIAAGDLTVEKLKIDSKDEIGQLSASINTMTENLTRLIRYIQDSAEQLAATSEELSAGAQTSIPSVEILWKSD